MGSKLIKSTNSDRNRKYDDLVDRSMNRVKAGRKNIPGRVPMPKPKKGETPRKIK